MINAKTKATASRKKDDVSSSSAPSTLPRHWPSEAWEISWRLLVEVLKPSLKHSLQAVIAMTCHVLDYESSDSEDSIFAFALSFSYTTYSFHYFIYLFANIFYFLYNMMQ